MSVADQNSSSFAQLGLGTAILQALGDAGYVTPTPIQVQTIPHVLKGRDVLGCAQTGTGKTAAFALPLLERLNQQRAAGEKRVPRILILTPTRELATQIAENVAIYGRHLKTSCAVIFGGVKQGPQADALRRGVDVIVATPGRLLDLIGQKLVNLSQIEALVLDEADRMLDMGFIQPVRRIVAVLPRQRQNLLFSATMPKEIAGLAAQILRDPVNVAVTPVASTATRISQHVMFVNSADKRTVLRDLLRDHSMSRVLVFTRTKHGANRVTMQLERANVSAQAIHGNKSQSARQKSLEAFRSGQVRVLVATDIASRGIDVDGVTHVINFDLPNEPESYVHRIGRTARGGASGIAISLCDNSSERTYLRDIEKLIGKSLNVQSVAAN